MIEEYYTLAVIGKAGLGTPHMDGNTRWCTATASSAFQESFGCDGQPGSYTDVDHCDALFLFGHNVAETQTVLWARMLDRLEGADPPRLVCVDPRRTKVAERATVHLPVVNGAIFITNTERTAALASWLQYYNTQRPHAALGGQPTITRVRPTSWPGSFSAFRRRIQPSIRNAARL